MGRDPLNNIWIRIEEEFRFLRETSRFEELFCIFLTKKQDWKTRRKFKIFSCIFLKETFSLKLEKTTMEEKLRC